MPPERDDEDVSSRGMSLQSEIGDGGSHDGSSRGIPQSRQRRSSTSFHCGAVNSEIDRHTDDRIRRYAGSSREAIMHRIGEVERELEVNAPSLAVTGRGVGATVDKKWLTLPAGVLPFLLQHALQGWCPPLPLLRRLGLRTQGEIDREKYALKELLARY